MGDAPTNLDRMATEMPMTGRLTPDKEAEVQRMLAMGREIRAHMRGPVSSDTSDMYDENGLPL